MADIPAGARKAALAALRQRQPGLEIADLDPIETISDRPWSGAKGRAISFSTPDRHIQIVADEPAITGTRLHIVLDPPATATVELWNPGVMVAAGRTDDAGLVDLEGVPHGPLSVVCRYADAPGMQTSWVTL